MKFSLQKVVSVEFQLDKNMVENVFFSESAVVAFICTSVGFQMIWRAPRTNF